MRIVRCTLLALVWTYLDPFISARTGSVRTEPRSTEPQATPDPPLTQAGPPVPREPISILSIIAREDNLSFLSGAIILADIDEVLKGRGPLTVFCPTNEAFAADQDWMSRLLKPDWVAHLRALLTFHILFLNRVLASNVPSQGTALSTLLVPPENITATATNTDGISISGESFMDSMVVEADLLATNGVVHKVDKLFMPTALTLNLLEMAQGIDSFGQVSSLIALAGLEETLRTDILTIFAPGDASFAKVPADLAFSVENDSMTRFLENHIVRGLYPKVKLTDGAVFTTIAGGSLTVSVGTGPFAETKIDEAVVKFFDMVASNGIAHSIDNVLVPPDEIPGQSANPSTVLSVIEGETDLSTFAQAFHASGLDTFLRGPIALTIFSPTDEAFAAAADQQLMSKLLQPDWIAHLRALLTFHISYDNRVLASDIPPDGITLSTLLVPTETITATTKADGIVVGGESFTQSNVVQADLVADNGVVHKVSNVFIPTSLTLNLFEFAQENESFSRISRLITLSGLEDIPRNRIVTVFTADDEAFDALPTDLTAEAVIDRSIMIRILKHHFVEGIYSRVKLLDGTTMKTLAGTLLTASVAVGIVPETKINDAVVQVFDVVASNGLSHQIDRVLIPPEEL